MNIIRLRALERRKIITLTGLQLAILARAKHFVALGFSRKAAIDIALDEEY